MRALATLPVLTLEGTPADMGIEYGKAMSSLISPNLDDYLRRFRDVARLSDEDVTRWGEVYARQRTNTKPLSTRCSTESRPVPDTRRLTSSRSMRERRSSIAPRTVMTVAHHLLCSPPTRGYIIR